MKTIITAIVLGCCGICFAGAQSGQEMLKDYFELQTAQIASQCLAEVKTAERALVDVLDAARVGAAVREHPHHPADALLPARLGTDHCCDAAHSSQFFRMIRYSVLSQKPSCSAGATSSKWFPR